MSAAHHVVNKVNAPYGADLTPEQIAQVISDASAIEVPKAIGVAFSFFTELSAELQTAFITEMGVRIEDVQRVARSIAERCANPVPLAA
jgi:hypothetical protein